MSNSLTQNEPLIFGETSAPPSLLVLRRSEALDFQKQVFRSPLRLYIVLIVHACHFQFQEAIDLSVSTPYQPFDRCSTCESLERSFYYFILIRNCVTS
jgi:hypothetical protein